MAGTEFDPMWRQASRLDRFLRNRFPERHVLIRSDQGASHFKIGSRFQAALTALALAVGLWGAHATWSYVEHGFIVAGKDQEIASARDAHASVLIEVDAYRATIARIGSDLQRNYDHTLALARRNEGLLARVKGLEVDLAEAQKLRHEAQVARVSLVKELDQLQSSVSTAAKDAEPASAPAATAELDEDPYLMQAGYPVASAHAAEPEAQEMDRRHRALMGELAALGQGLDAIASTKGPGHMRLATIRSEIDRVVQQRDEARRVVGELSDTVDTLRGKISSLEETQKVVFERIHDLSKGRTALLEKNLAETGLNVEALLGKMAPDPGKQGGPFIPVDLSGATEDADLLGVFGTMTASLTRWHRLQSLLERVPVATPLKSYRITSGFGTRKDPITGTLARHEGVDFDAPEGTAIGVTAPGTVTHAGTRGHYGNMVEVRHAFGLTTRYAHLSQISVTVGQALKAGDKVGELGNTGRSTGAHLHYEVLLNHVPRNPMNYIKVGQDVFEGTAVE